MIIGDIKAARTNGDEVIGTEHEGVRDGFAVNQDAACIFKYLNKVARFGVIDDEKESLSVVVQIQTNTMRMEIPIESGG